ncbi:hypothetical protein [Pseudosporangium ferrugineum]|uniref:Uncharacterized protein n=1 Tax=Pseudosporangium ferrugineum TaxID=439699 RepID=A0A2T0RG68_9ACTN|nr:hypothetical protein [Pseudosporangium ferrugineum]PRY20139.1 hypothetical protein CLV70_12520 [Pseudosporangium ferrugineum]
MASARLAHIALLVGAIALQPAVAGCRATPPRADRATPVVSAVGERDVIGRTVTISGKIIDVLTPTSFVMAADDFGDLSLLVLSGGRPGLTKGQTLTFDGNIQKFSFAAYRDEYDLTDRQAYAPFEGEKIVVMLPGHPVTTPSTAPPE